MAKGDINPRDTVQLDVDDPYRERLDKGGRKRLNLNAREKMYARKRKMAEQAVAIMMTLPFEAGLAEALQKEGLDPVEVSSMITNHTSWEGNETEALKEAARKRAADMFLDVERQKPFSNAEIARAIGISTSSLRKLVATQEFQEIYNDSFFRSVSDPRIKAVQEATAELAPLVFTTLKDLLTRRATADSVRLRAAIFLAEKLGLVKEPTVQSDRNELAKFLGEKGLTVNNVQVNVGLPEEFMAQVNKFMPKEKTVHSIIEGDLDTPDIDQV